MHCRQVRGLVVCSGGKGSRLAFSGPPPASTSPTGTTKSTSAEASTTTATDAVEGPGSTSHATDNQFCDTHHCIDNFSNGNGYIVQCVDGEWSHSGGLSGACSYHGGDS